MNRSTVGQKQDLNMARFQEMPLIPKRGYTPKKEIEVKAYVTALPPTDNITLREQQRRDRMAANNRRTTINRMDKLKKLFAGKEMITAADAMKILDYPDVRRANEALSRMKDAGLVEKALVEKKGKTYWRMVK